MSEQTGKNGWIKLHKKAFLNPVINKDSHYFHIWFYLLTHANYSSSKAFFGGELITLQPGQLITGREKMAKACKVDRSKVERIIKTFIFDHQIEQQTTNKSRLITIKNWKQYQQSKQKNEQQMSNKRATSEQQVSTNKRRIRRIEEEKENTSREREVLFFWDRSKMNKRKIINGRPMSFLGHRILETGENRPNGYDLCVDENGDSYWLDTKNGDKIVKLSKENDK